MSVLPSPSQIASYRTQLEQLLAHTCTVTLMTAGTEDHHYNAVPTAGTVTTGVPCRFETVQRATRDENGVTLVSTSTLSASATGPVAVGVQISAVTDQLGGTPPGAAGTFVVDAVDDDTAGLGGAFLPIFRLRAADTELS